MLTRSHVFVMVGFELAKRTALEAIQGREEANLFDLIVELFGRQGSIQATKQPS